MGCYNHKGSFSNLPITCGDRIVVLVGIRTSSPNADHFAPGFSFTPVSLPIRGEYNDYGGVESVDRDLSTEKLESFFNMEIEDIVDVAERIEADCSEDVNIEQINNALVEATKDSYHPYNTENCSFGYIMEHEHIFDKMCAMSDCNIKDQNFWRIPHYMIESLGYEKELTGKDNSYELITWHHKTLPTLKENCYIWLENDYGNYSNIPHTFAELCEKIGCEVPDEFNKSYLTSQFDEDLNVIANSKNELDAIKLRRDYQSSYSFMNDLFAPCGLFRYSDALNTDYLCCMFNTKNNEHIKEEFKKGFVEIAALIRTLRTLEMTWGVTNYYRQDVNYDAHIEFTKTCLDFITEKKNSKED